MANTTLATTVSPSAKPISQKSMNYLARATPCADPSRDCDMAQPWAFCKPPTCLQRVAPLWDVAKVSHSTCRLSFIGAAFERKERCYQVEHARSFGSDVELREATEGNTLASRPSEHCDCEKSCTQTCANTPGQVHLLHASQLGSGAHIPRHQSRLSTIASLHVRFHASQGQQPHCHHLDSASIHPLALRLQVDWLYL